MNDLPDNELLSAYLDGEVTAAERQQIEELLATSPATRRLLEQLRALSNTLHALPRESLGEDLSPRVLRLAERRMLTGEQSDVARVEDAPMPLGRSLLHRFTRPRILFWLSVTAIVAVMIRLNEQRQAPLHAPQKIASAPATPREPLPPSSMRAYPAAKAAAKAAPAGPAIASAPAESVVREAVAEPTLTKPMAGKSAPAKSMEGESAPAKSASVAKQNHRLVEMDKAQVADSVADVAKKGSRDDKDGEIAKDHLNRMKNKEAAKEGQNEKGEQSRKSPVQQKPVEAVMVVNCDVSPEAAKKQTFDRLLASNGIVWQQEGVPGARYAPPNAPPPQPTASPAPRNGPAIAKGAEPSSKPLVEKKPIAALRLVEQQTENPSVERKMQQSAVGGQNVQPPPDEGEWELVYVEATAAQIDATLKSLAARPEAFPSLYVQPAAGETSQQSFSRYNRFGGSQQVATAGAAKGADASRPASPSARAAKRGTADRDSRALQAIGGRVETDGVLTLSAGKEAASVPLAVVRSQCAASTAAKSDVVSGLCPASADERRRAIAVSTSGEPCAGQRPDSRETRAGIPEGGRRNGSASQGGPRDGSPAQPTLRRRTKRPSSTRRRNGCSSCCDIARGHRAGPCHSCHNRRRESGKC